MGVTGQCHHEQVPACIFEPKPSAMDARIQKGTSALAGALGKVPSGPLTSITTPVGCGSEERLPRETCAVVSKLRLDEVTS